MEYKGKPCLDDSSSFKLREACEHWHRELAQAVENEKTVIVFLVALEEVFVGTCERTLSGTGRNSRATREVVRYTNYAALPLSITPINATGNVMTLAPLGAEILAAYWQQFRDVSEYKVLLPNDIGQIAITTKSGNRPVGAIITRTGSSGSLILLPGYRLRPRGLFPRKPRRRVGLVR
jgi:hypothetical protein